MIKEDYVSYEVAKLLKEKGFNSECRAAYTNYGKLFTTQIQQYITNAICSKGYLWDCTAPTHQMAIAWLRKTHKLFIEIHIEQGEKVSYKFMIWDFYIIHPNKYVGGIYDLREEQKGFSTPEQAIETALKYSLENLI